MTEPTSTAIFLTAFGLLLTVSVVFSRTLERLGVPVVLLFLVLGMLAGSEGIGGLAFDDYSFAFRVGVIALILILFDGGLNTSISSIRTSAKPASVLATFGVLGAAGLLALFCRFIGLSWSEALLVGAVASSTDAAAVFAVLRGGGIRLRPRIGRTLELESGVNDPLAFILTAAIVGHATGSSPVSWFLLLAVPLQIILGLGVGIGFGYGARALLIRLRPTAGGLFAVVTLAVAFLSFGFATLIGGSGFLAVYVAAVLLGNGPLPYQGGLRRIHDAIAWLSQITMFVMLGLLVFPSRLLDVAGIGLLLGLFLAFIARPVSVALCLLPFRFKPAEVLYLGWVGLRGAVPIILATFPIIAGAPGAERVFDIIFFVVVVNAIVPGASIRWLARRLNLEEPDKPAPAAVLEINSTRMLKGDILSFHVDKSLAVCDAALSQINFPKDAAAILIVRGEELLAPRGPTILREGDHVFVFCRPEDRPYIQLLFGRPEGESQAYLP